MRARGPLAVYVVAASVYVAMLGSRRMETSPDNHFAHLASSFLHGRLDQGGDPPGTNDWACYDTVEHGPCPNGQFAFPGAAPGRYRWYVSFPPLPAVVMMPLVATRGVAAPDRLFWALFAGFGPSMVYVLLRFLRESGKSERSLGDDLWLTGLFAFGSVYFFVAEQGTVWFAAHVTAVPLLALFLLFAFDARRPLAAGVALGLLFLTRPTTAPFALFFLFETIRSKSRDPLAPRDELASPFTRTVRLLRDVRWGQALRTLVVFSVPILVAGSLAMAMNRARFGDPFEFGHEYLQIFWRSRIEKWGLFNYHYVGKNLAVMLASLPWLSRTPPFVVVSGHGLALWVTTPALILVLFPARVTQAMRALAWPTLFVCVFNLMYQNSGWLQFGYRFSLDYAVALFVLLALGGRRFGLRFRTVALLAIAINTFGALTFDRAPEYYHVDGTQNVLFQPD